MRWFRERIRNGAWLALTALAINLALSFGHVHGPDGRHSEGVVSALIAAVTSSGSDRSQGHPGDVQPDTLCPICMAASAMGNAVAATPPALQADFTYAVIDRPVEPVIAFVQQPRAAFRSRGPPLS